MADTRILRVSGILAIAESRFVPMTLWGELVRGPTVKGKVLGSRSIQRPFYQHTTLGVVKGKVLGSRSSYAAGVPADTA